MPDKRKHRGPAPGDMLIFGQDCYASLCDGVRDLSMLLSKGYLLDGDLYPQIPTCNHDSVTVQNDITEVVHCLLSLNFCDNLYPFPPIVVNKFPNVYEVFRSSYKRCRNKINILFDEEFDIIEVLFHEKGQRQGCPRKVQALRLAQLPPLWTRHITSWPWISSI